MIYHKQTKMGFPGPNGEIGPDVGNCFQTAVASVFGLPLEEVPHFCSEENWWDSFQYWLQNRGMYAIEFQFEDGRWPSDVTTVPGNIHCLISGKSPRGEFNHTVVGLTRIREDLFDIELLHDPHPDNTFIRTAESVIFLAVFDPSRMVK